MLNKNHDVRVAFSELGPNIILVSKPFHKAEFVNSLLDSVDYPVTFLDFDLLYSGYVTSKLVQKRDHVSIFCPQRNDWKQILHGVLAKIHQEKSMVIIDSFNGLHNMYSDKDSGRFVNASLMLLAFIGQFKRCPIIVMALARKNQKNRWVLSPGGRQIINSKNLNFYILDRDSDTLSVTPIEYVQ